MEIDNRQFYLIKFLFYVMKIGCNSWTVWHLPRRLKKFSSSSLPFSIPLPGPPSESFTALVNFTWGKKESSWILKFKGNYLYLYWPLPWKNKLFRIWSYFSSNFHIWLISISYSHVPKKASLLSVIWKRILVTDWKWNSQVLWSDLVNS